MSMEQQLKRGNHNENKATVYNWSNNICLFCRTGSLCSAAAGHDIDIRGGSSKETEGKQKGDHQKGKEEDGESQEHPPNREGKIFEEEDRHRKEKRKESHLKSKKEDRKSNRKDHRKRLKRKEENSEDEGGGEEEGFNIKKEHW